MSIGLSPEVKDNLQRLVFLSHALDKSSSVRDVLKYLEDARDCCRTVDGAIQIMQAEAQQHKPRPRDTVPPAVALI